MADITGMSAFSSALAAFSGEVVLALPGIVHAAVQVIEAEIRARAPVDTGEVVHDLDTVTVATPTGATATVQIEQSSQNGAAHHAIFVEYGTSQMAAEPFFRPGVQAKRSEALSIIERGVAAVVAKHGG